MTQRITKMKDQLIEYAASHMGNGLESVDTREMGEVVDMIKDLAEAEKACYEAEYYDSVVDAMGDRYGYDGQSQTRSYDRMGYRNQYGNFPANPSNRRLRGYSDESVENIRQMMRGADPQRKEQLKRDLQDLMNEI